MEEARRTAAAPYVAAALAWLVPGAGHIYLRKWKKGLLFFFCLILLYIFGVALGSWSPYPERSWNYPEQGEPPPVSIVSPRNHQVIYAIQALTGLPTLVVTAVNRGVKVDSPTTITDLGQVITMVIGALNMLLIVDAFCVSQIGEPRRDA